MHTITLRGLPGARPRVRAGVFSSVSGALAVLRKGLAATTADDNGAINVWRNKKGELCGHICRHMAVVEFRNFLTVSQLVPWLKGALVKIGRNPSL